jgi:hypothetical protein
VHLVRPQVAKPSTRIDIYAPMSRSPNVGADAIIKAQLDKFVEKPLGSELDLSSHDHWMMKPVAHNQREKLDILIKALKEITKISHEDGVERYVARAALMLIGERIE